jgi:hypothetical protein
VTPVSTTATVTALLPREVCQAVVTRVRLRPHWVASSGSSGVITSAYAVWSGST